MNIRYYLGILLFGIFAYLVLTPRSLLNSKSEEKNPPVENEVIAVQSPPQRHEFSKNETKRTPEARNQAVDLSGVDAHEMRKKNFTSMLGQLSSCLEIKNSTEAQLVEPRIENVIASVQSDLGEPVIRSEDANSTEVQNSKGEKKLIKIETLYENENIVRKLRYYDITDKGLAPIFLTEDQTVEPSESLIASLESDGQVIKREKSERVFFQNGEEIFYTQQNGEVHMIEISKLGKTLKCKDLSQSQAACQCK